MIVKTPYGEGILKEMRADGIMIIQLRSRAGHGFHGYFNHTQVSLVKQFNLTEGNVNLAPALLDLYNQGELGNQGDSAMEISEVNGVEIDCTGNKPKRMGKRNSQDLYSGEDYEYIASLSKDDNQMYSEDPNGHNQMDIGLGGDENYNSMNINTGEQTFDGEPVHEFEPKRKKSLISTDTGLNTYLSNQATGLQERSGVSGSGIRSNSVPFGLGRNLDDSSGMMEC